MSFIRASSSATTRRLLVNSSRIQSIQSSPRLVRFASSDGHQVNISNTPSPPPRIPPHNADPAAQVLPFSYTNKHTFKFKFLAFLLTGFSVPFIAVGYQL